MYTACVNTAEAITVFIIVNVKRVLFLVKSGVLLVEIIYHTKFDYEQY